jgi:hypothetical protein
VGQHTQHTAHIPQHTTTTEHLTQQTAHSKKLHIHTHIPTIGLAALEHVSQMHLCLVHRHALALCRVSD